MTPEELRDIRGSEIAMIYQEPMAALNPAMKIGKQLMEVPMIHEGVGEKEAYARALEVVTDVKLPDPERMLQSYPHQLSGGQQQRIVIAMALMSKPSLLILDEPTTALDVTVEAAVVELVKDLGKKYGTSMLFISHNLGLVLETCDRICVMYSGEAVETGSIKDVFDKMQHPYTQALFRSIPLPGADKNARPLVAIPGNFPLPHERPKGCNFGPRCDYFDEGRCNEDMRIPMEEIAGDDRHFSRCLKFKEIDWNAPIDVGAQPEKPEPGQVVLKMDNLKKYYEVAANALFGGGDKKVVKANETLSFEARESETLAIVGESGCGKSTLARAVLKLEPQTAGTIAWMGRDISGADRKPMNSLRDDLQIVFQDPMASLDPRMTIGTSIGEPLTVHSPDLDKAARERRVQEIMPRVGLDPALINRYPHELSGGQNQRVGIARAMILDPKLVICDEAVSALDVSVQAQVVDLLIELQKEFDLAMIFISHDLSVVREISHRVMVLYLGKVVEIAGRQEIYEDARHPYTRQLISAVPNPDPKTERSRERVKLQGDLPSPLDTRAPLRFLKSKLVDDPDAQQYTPKLIEIAPGHTVAEHDAFDGSDGLVA